MVSRVGIAITLIASLMLIAAIACQSAPASPAPDQPPTSTEQPVQLMPQEPEMAEAPAPIESVDVLVSESTPTEYSLLILSRLPRGSSCSRFGGFEISQDGTTVMVTMTNLEVTAQNVPCTADLPVVSTDIPLGSDFVPGETYTIVVNGQTTNSFVARDPEGREMVEKTSPVESVELVVSESTPLEYSLTVISRLPMGSSCSQFNGYDIASQYAGKIDITVTHLEITAQNALCTADLPVVSTDIPLGSNFVPGETYTVVVNDEVIETFMAQ